MPTLVSEILDVILKYNTENAILKWQSSNIIHILKLLFS